MSYHSCYALISPKGINATYQGTIVNNDGHLPRSCSWSKTEILAAGSLAYKVGVEAVERRDLVVLLQVAPANSIKRRKLANAALGEDYTASYMETGNPWNMKHDCLQPYSSNPRNVPADLKVAGWPCRDSLNERKTDIYYLSEIDSSYSGAC